MKPRFQLPKRRKVAFVVVTHICANSGFSIAHSHVLLHALLEFILDTLENHNGKAGGGGDCSPVPVSLSLRLASQLPAQLGPSASP